MPDKDRTDRTESFAELVPKATPLGEASTSRAGHPPEGGANVRGCAHSSVTAKTGAEILPPYSDADRDAVLDGVIKLCEKHSKGGISEKDLKKMRSGKVDVEDEFDLHGLTAREAHEGLVHFLRDALLQEAKIVDVCHGKGFTKGCKPVLGPLVRHWLKASAVVLAFTSPADNQGMVRIRLRSSRKLP